MENIESTLAAIEARHVSRMQEDFISQETEDIDALLALVREQQDKLVRIEAELHHAEDNGHRLDGDCQGVAPGQRIPAVRIDFIRAAITATEVDQ
jgi:hypothetical protein